VRERVGYLNTSLGWHPDPCQPGIERFWDGRRWRERPIGLSGTGEGGIATTGVPSASTVGFELPSPEVLAQTMGAVPTKGAVPKKRAVGSKRFRFGSRRGRHRSPHHHETH
jgi:hypothetical protein